MTEKVHDKEFHDMLRRKMQEPLLSDVGLLRFQHVERLANEEVEGLLDGEVVVETKLDGANVSVAYYQEHGIVVASRNLVIYKDGKYLAIKAEKDKPNEYMYVEPDKLKELPPGFNVSELKDVIGYVLSHSGIQTMVYAGYILRGEWAIEHSIRYREDVYGHFYLFDVQEKNAAGYVHPDVWQPIAKENGVRYISILAKLNKPTVDRLVELTKGPDEFGAEQKEGVVIKRYDFWNKSGRQTWGKLVSKDFTEANKLKFGAKKDDPPELRFVANIIDYPFIMKEIKKLEEDMGRKLIIQDMPRVLSHIWKTAFDEELFQFVKDESVGAFDFKVARRLAEKKTREIALSYFNAIPSVFVR